MRQAENMKPFQSDQVQMGISQQLNEFMETSKGHVFIELTWPDGTVIETREHQNMIVWDAGILIARLLKNSLVPNLNKHNGINMLAVGTGAVGSDRNPDAPKKGQRRLNTELFRKVVTATYRTENGQDATAFPTHVIDFTATFGTGEANGPLNEMGLLSAYNVNNPSPGNPIVNGPDDYDETIDVTNLDLFANYFTFPLLTKPVGSVMTVTWRFTI